MAENKNILIIVGIVIVVLLLIGPNIKNLFSISLEKPIGKPVLLSMNDFVKENTDAELIVASDFLFGQREGVYAVYLDEIQKPICTLSLITQFGRGGNAPTDLYKCVISEDKLTVGEHKIKFVYGNRYSTKAQCCLLAGQNIYNEMKQSRNLDFGNKCVVSQEENIMCSLADAPIRVYASQGVIDVYGPAEFSPETLVKQEIKFTVLQEAVYTQIIEEPKCPVFDIPLCDTGERLVSRDYTSNGLICSVPVCESISGITTTTTTTTTQPKICPSVCRPMYRLTKAPACYYDACGSGCGPDNINTFETEEQCELYSGGICPVYDVFPCKDNEKSVAGKLQKDGCFEPPICVPIEKTKFPTSLIIGIVIALVIAILIIRRRT